MNGQLDVCCRKLERIDGVVRGALAARIENVAARALPTVARARRSGSASGDNYFIAGQAGSAVRSRRARDVGGVLVAQGAPIIRSGSQR